MCRVRPVSPQGLQVAPTALTPRTLTTRCRTRASLANPQWHPMVPAKHIGKRFRSRRTLGTRRGAGVHSFSAKRSVKEILLPRPSGRSAARRDSKCFRSGGNAPSCNQHKASRSRTVSPLLQEGKRRHRRSSSSESSSNSPSSSSSESSDSDARRKKRKSERHK